MRYAVIDTATNTIVNVIIWDGVSTYNPGEGLTLVSLAGKSWGIGWIRQDDDYIES